MATQHETPDGPRIFLKGAPEAVLEICGHVRRRGVDQPLSEDARQSFHAVAERMAGDALRLLAVAVVDGATIDGQAGFAAFGNRATLLDLVGQLDPPPVEMKDAVPRCREAGIRPVMVTGDHRATAQAIARELGIARATPRWMGVSSSRCPMPSWR